MRIKTTKIYTIIIGILCIIVLILLYFLIKDQKNNNNSYITHDNNSEYKFTNPILDCEVNQFNNKVQIFSESINKKVEELKEKFQLEHVSVYYRDLNNGPWVGVEEKEVFTPASLLKVPVMMALLKESEKKPSLLDKKIQTKEVDFEGTLIQNLDKNKSLVAGKEYSLLEVTKIMIEQSDNVAVRVLLNNIDGSYVGNVFKSIGVPYSDNRTEIDVRVKDYAGFFRVLFNASYLNREMSETALEILSKSEYVSGIVAGVPKGIVVAHKFGERGMTNLNYSSQLHDCGIVYHPNMPYIICIMTRGNDMNNQEKVIQEISKYVYNEVDKTSSKN